MIEEMAGLWVARKLESSSDEDLLEWVQGLVLDKLSIPQLGKLLNRVQEQYDRRLREAEAMALIRLNA
jgi:hypothetical protein